MVVRYKQAFRSFLWKGLQNRQEEIDACIERKYSINSYRSKAGIHFMKVKQDSGLFCIFCISLRYQRQISDK